MSAIEEFEIAIRPRFYSNVRLGKVMRKLGPKVLREIRALKKEMEGLVKPPLCRQCGKRVEPLRACYAVPVCYDCLPPPPELETIDTGGSDGEGQ